MTFFQAIYQNPRLEVDEGENSIKKGEFALGIRKKIDWDEPR